MIPKGHKITVLASSKTKPGSTVRRGSTGFVAGIGTPHDFSRHGMYIIPAKIVFNRFGFENKSRNEAKFVTIVQPCSPPSKIVHLQRTLNNLTKKSIDMSDKIITHFKKEGVKQKPTASIVLMRTDNQIDLTKNLNSLKAWTSSILQSGELHPMIMADKQSNLNKAREEMTNGYPAFAQRLKDCVLYKKQSDEFIDSIADNEVLKLLLISKLKEFVTLLARKEVNIMTKELSNRWLNRQKLYTNLWYFVNNNLEITKESKSNYQFIPVKQNVDAWTKRFASFK